MAAAKQRPPVCAVKQLRHRYGDHEALQGIDLQVRPGQIFALLGPNGSGKTTLFRLLCTLLPVQSGQISVGGFDSSRDPLKVRGLVGIVFQSPSLDKKLTVDENIAFQGALYGIQGEQLRKRRDYLLEQLELTARRGEFCETLSGGLKRRVELVKGLLHQPQLLLLDEPSTGLDPSARLKLWESIRRMADEGVAVLLTTHLLEEADKADRVAIMSDGKIIAEDSPHALRAEMGKGIVTLVATNPGEVETILQNEFQLKTQRFHDQIRFESDSPAEKVKQLSDRFGQQLQSISIGRPSLEDVFIARTGKEFTS